jgi:hypothetical protein
MASECGGWTTLKSSCDDAAVSGGVKLWTTLPISTKSAILLSGYYFADTLLFAGAILALASATPRTD